MLIYHNLIEHLMSFFSSGTFKKELFKAQSEFCQKFGQFEVCSQQFESKMDYFFEWYLMSRLMRDKKTPLEVGLANKKLQLSDDEWVYYKNLIQSRHSLFQFVKIKKSEFFIQDLFSGYYLNVKRNFDYTDFKKRDIFEARIIPHNDGFLFSKCFYVHPQKSQKFILNYINTRKKQDSQIDKEKREQIVFWFHKFKIHF